MSRIYKSAEGERQVRERYLAFLKWWPVEHQEIRVPTSQGETFVVACGSQNAPALLLLHGGAGNCAMWMGEVSAYAQAFRVYCIDMIGEAGLSAASRPRLASDAHAVWLDDVLRGLSVERTSIVGISLGGWLALDYATRRPEKVECLAVMCPGGVGRQKAAIVLQTLVLRAFGKWGRRKLAERVLGRAPTNPSPAMKTFLDFVVLIHRHFRIRMVKMPVFSDEALRRLNMPVLAIVGARDVLLDSAETKRRLESQVRKARVVYLPEAGHLITGQAVRIIKFLHPKSEVSH